MNEVADTNVISLDEKLRERQTEMIIGEVKSIYNTQGGIVQEYLDLMIAEPDKAIDRLEEYIERARGASTPSDVSTSYVEAISGGPNPDFIVPILNIAATRYDQLHTEGRRLVISGQLAFFNGINFHYSRQHVARINNPLVIRDICASSSLYWPGVDTELDLLEAKPDVKAFNQFAQTCRSLGLLAFSVVGTNTAPLPIRRSFRNSSPQLYDTGLDLAASRYFHSAARITDVDPQDMPAIIEAKIQKNTDPQDHDLLRRKVAAADWIRVHAEADICLWPATETQLAYDEGRLVLA